MDITPSMCATHLLEHHDFDAPQIAGMPRTAHKKNSISSETPPMFLQLSSFHWLQRDGLIVLACFMEASVPGLKARLMCGSCLKSFVSTIWKQESLSLDVSTAWNLHQIVFASFVSLLTKLICAVSHLKLWKFVHYNLAVSRSQVSAQQ